MNPETLNFYKKVSLMGLVLFVLAAWFSIGYHHPDEHFQILEFANYKLGNTTVADLPWEFQGQIRPALPVFITYLIFKIVGFLGVTNPFVLAFLLRLIAGLLSWFVLSKLALLLQSQFKTEAGKKIFFSLLFILWFVPYLSVRFSGENLSAITFLSAVYLLLIHSSKSKGKQFVMLFCAGLLLGFTFYFRFQMAFAILGLGIWIVIVQRLNLKLLLTLIAGGIFALGLSLLLDFWLYGNWVLSPVNYFTANIVDDIASGFGVSPWWNYFYLAFLQIIPPISIVLILFFFYGASKSMKHLFLWTLIPFLIGHFVVGHKEMRFLFPMIFSFLFIASIGIDAFMARGKYLSLSKLVLWLLVVVNLPLLIGRTILPCREQTAYQKFLYDYAAKKKIELVTYEEGIYRNAALNVNFYKSENVNNIVLPDQTAFQNYLAIESPDEIYFISRKNSEQIEFSGYDRETIYSFIPDWVLQVNINDWTSRANIWKINKLTRHS